MRAPRAPHRTDTLIDQAIDRTIDLAIMVGLGILILIGFATSYRTLRDLAATQGGYPDWLAPAVPLSFDLGIVVLSLKVARAAREGRTAPVMRLLVAALSTATVVANAAAAATPTARLLHAVPPAMFVICFESVVISSRRAALEARGLLPSPLPRLRAVRWVLDFPATWTQWRRTVLELDPDSPPPALARQPAPPGPSAIAPAVRSAGVLTRDQPPDPANAPAAPRPNGRDELADKLLKEHPQMPAAELARRLWQAGWQVSTRTAQRIRARRRA